jgi:hypothetical protein
MRIWWHSPDLQRGFLCSRVFHMLTRRRRALITLGRNKYLTRDQSDRRDVINAQFNLIRQKLPKGGGNVLEMGDH